MKLVATEALILRSTAYGESDKIITLLSPLMGRVSGIAKGARKSIKRFGPCLEPFVKANLVIRSGEKFSSIIEGSTLKVYKSIRGDIYRFAFGNYILELTDAILEGTDLSDSEKIYSLLLGAFESMDNQGDPETVARTYEAELLAFAGYLPSFLSCVVCGSGLVEGNIDRDGAFFSISRGGAVCTACAGDGRGLERVSSGTLKTLEVASRGRVSFTKNALHESGRIMPPFIAHHIGRKLKSLDFISGIKEV